MDDHDAQWAAIDAEHARLRTLALTMLSDALAHADRARAVLAALDAPCPEPPNAVILPTDIPRPSMAETPTPPLQDDPAARRKALAAERTRRYRARRRDAESVTQRHASVTQASHSVTQASHERHAEGGVGGGGPGEKCLSQVPIRQTFTDKQSPAVASESGPNCAHTASHERHAERHTASHSVTVVSPWSDNEIDLIREGANLIAKCGGKPVGNSAHETIYRGLLNATNPWEGVTDHGIVRAALDVTLEAAELDQRSMSAGQVKAYARRVIESANADERLPERGFRESIQQAREAARDPEAAKTKAGKERIRAMLERMEQEAQ